MQTDTHVYIPLVYAYTGHVHKHKWLPLAVEASEFEIESQRRKNTDFGLVSKNVESLK